jgi:hypothetical protein
VNRIVGYWNTFLLINTTTCTKPTHSLKIYTLFLFRVPPLLSLYVVIFVGRPYITGAAPTAYPILHTALDWASAAATLVSATPAGAFAVLLLLLWFLLLVLTCLLPLLLLALARAPTLVLVPSIPAASALSNNTCMHATESLSMSCKKVEVGR